MPILYILETADASCTHKELSLSVKLLHSLQEKKALNDEQLANLIGISINELAQIKKGDSTLSAKSKFKLFDGFGYVVVRDIVLGFLPSDLASRLIQLDTEHGKKINTPTKQTKP